MSDRSRILEGLPEGAADDLPAPWPIPSHALTRDQLWEAFASKLPELGARMASFDEVRELAPRQAAIDPDALPFVENLGLLESPIWEAKVGVTLAELAVAHSGSVLLSQAPGRMRMASLAPEIHVVLVPEDRIVWSLEEALQGLSDRTSVLITGSSRTADIESVLVRGVHGPKEVWVVRVEEVGRR